ncbi:tRNA (cytidine/uridine-2'-O-)-methyltransferase TrmJ [Fundidesulfovibrio magnetotacticus]|uniref:tRNA (Cytidine/uridine-2'-O-)-methyltransferase TrmJ n=1 Tax=Fundidesulfovibrio magnetotacticus TaxID=2730080 RepID=A0A6V8LT77_9BACT|nr:RNA methyltransferase [Fundidesulfovibrio magnetotacticus]GFK95672.1 tRNA (cytidine/uridine-2'-O-)-methyltransferase TrmJ [Fundidesulfovibrio magnetotacticus]
MLNNLGVVLFRPKFSENVGSAARAMANMGCRDLVLVDPQDFDPGRARALATAKGQEILETMRVVPDLAQALAPYEAVYGTTARTGGWRKGLLTAETAARRGVETLRQGGRVALLFGPEDKGLTNDETKVCSRLVTIPTDAEATSLNLAQAALLVLYEFLKASRATPAPAAFEPGSRQATFDERESLFAALRETLLAVDFLKADNPDYWMLPVRSFVERIRLKRAEFNLLMGVCRQVRWAVGQRDKAQPGQGRDGQGAA